MMPALSPLPSASSRGASQRGCSELWAQCGVGGSTAPSKALFAAASHYDVHQPSMSVPPITHTTTLAPPITHTTTLAPPITHTTTLALPRQPPLVRDEARAVRAAEERIANHAHVGPHVGPGSGAGLNFYISRLKGRLDRLDDFLDDPDTDDSENESESQRRRPPYNRLMSY